MAKKATKSLTDNTFVKAANKAVEKGLSPDDALDAAAAAAGVSPLREMPLAVRQDLGLDDLETAQTFGKMVTRRYFEADMNGQFPQWIEEVEDSTDRAKLKMDWIKTHKQTLADALITKKEKHTHDEGIFAGRSNEDILWYMTHDGRFPEEMTINSGEPQRHN